MKKLFILLGAVLAIVSSSCTKKAADMIVGHWRVSNGGTWDVFQPNAVWEFDSDGTMRFEYYGNVYQGSYSVDGPYISLLFYDRPDNDWPDVSISSGRIIDLDDDYMRWNVGNAISFYRTKASISDSPGGSVVTEGSTISVTGDTWFVLDHQYSDGETIHLENATFGLYGAADDGGHQQLISGGEEGTGEQLRIGQAGLIWTDYSFVYFNMIEMIQMDEYGYGHATSLSDGYILNNADVVFSPSNIYINGELVASYTTRHLDLNTNMCLFANNAEGWDVVQNQTATLGIVTITDAYSKVTAKYIPVLDDNGEPCFNNSVSGAYIYHSGRGTPIFSR